MKYCRYCGKEIHEKSNFCPYCMQSQLEKKSEIIYKKNSKKWVYILLIATVIIIIIAVLYFIYKYLLEENKHKKIIKKFLIISILSGLMTMFLHIPYSDSEDFLKTKLKTTPSPFALA